MQYSAPVPPAALVALPPSCRSGMQKLPSDATAIDGSSSNISDYQGYVCTICGYHMPQQRQLLDHAKIHDTNAGNQGHPQRHSNFSAKCYSMPPSPYDPNPMYSPVMRTAMLPITPESIFDNASLICNHEGKCDPSDSLLFSAKIDKRASLTYGDATSKPVTQGYNSTPGVLVSQYQRQVPPWNARNLQRDLPPIINIIPGDAVGSKRRQACLDSPEYPAHRRLRN